jgi:hypothetical protein
MSISAATVALVLAISAASAGAVGREVQRPEEQLNISIPLGNKAESAEIFAIVYPQRGVATVSESRDQGETKNSGGRSEGVGYAVHFPRRPLGSSFDFRIPTVGRIAGSFVPSGRPSTEAQAEDCEGPRPLFEVGHFVGEVALRPSAEGPTRRVRSVEASVTHYARLRCATYPETPRPGDGLFDYISRPLNFFGSSEVLISLIPSGSQTSEFIATGEPGARGGSSFEVRALERLPGGGAAARYVQFGAESPGRFTVSPASSANPATALLRPPAPFAGTATFHRHTAALTGSLSFKVFGRRVRLTGRKTRARLCVTPLGSARGSCSKIPHR